MARITFTFLLLITSMTAKADFSSAMENYKTEKFAEASEEFMHLAILGHKESQMNIGIMYYRGESVEENWTEAYSWMALASSDGKAEHIRLRDLVFGQLTSHQKQAAQLRVEDLTKQYGDGALKDILTAASDLEAKLQLNLIPDERQKIQYPPGMQKVGIEGTVNVSFNVDKLGFARDYSIIYANDKIFAKSALGPVKFWRYQPIQSNGKAIEIVDKEQRINYRFRNTSWDKKTIDNYVAELRTKAEQGAVEDMYAFAYIANLLPELKVRGAEAHSWLMRAASEGFPPAQYQLGKLYLSPYSPPGVTQKGFELLTLAAQSDHQNAEYIIGMSLLNSEDTKKNKIQGIEFLRRAAQAQHAKASMRLAWVLATDSEEKYRNPAEGLKLVTSVYETYPDRLRAHQTLAAAQAANGLFDQAAKTQLKAIKSAEEIDYPLEVEQQKLLAYQQRQAWRE